MFELDPRLENDTVAVTKFALSQVLLMRDARYPWLILVPARPGLRELHDLDTAGRAALMEEIARASRALEDLYAPDKINVGALGNIVAHRAGDAAWPGPVWGHGAPEDYAPDDLAATVARIGAALA